MIMVWVTWSTKMEQLPLELSAMSDNVKDSVTDPWSIPPNHVGTVFQNSICVFHSVKYNYFCLTPHTQAACLGNNMSFRLNFTKLSCVQSKCLLSATTQKPRKKHATTTQMHLIKSPQKTRKDHAKSTQHASVLRPQNPRQPSHNIALQPRYKHA